MWLHIKSISSNRTESEPQHHKRVKISTSVAHEGSSITHSSDRVGVNSRKRSENDSITTLQSISQDSATRCTRNLDGLPSVCCCLCTANFSLPLKSSKCCRGSIGMAKGYLGASSGYEHVIFDHSGPQSASSPASPSIKRDGHSVTEYLIHMTALQQLKTAYEVTMGLLKYSHTPWLQEEWSLSDVSYFGSSSFDHSTLCITKRLPTKISHNLLTTNAAKTSTQELQTLLGIRNAPLTSLGHALLELAHRKPLKDLRQPGDPHNTVAARRLVNGVDTIFGSRYRRIVRKCLEADFVVDCTDLSDGRLQTAVYNNVALELDSLAKDIESIMISV